MKDKIGLLTITLPGRVKDHLESKKQGKSIYKPAKMNIELNEDFAIDERGRKISAHEMEIKAITIVQHHLGLGKNRPNKDDYSFQLFK
jgi:hypothetical protein